MAKKSAFGKAAHEPVVKKTSSSGNPNMVKFSSMNKNKKKSYKAYRGQGR
jgi:hypothetical protein